MNLSMNVSASSSTGGSDDVAVVYICIDKAVSDPRIYYAIESLRRLAKYKGDIYVVTDRIDDLMNGLRQKGDDMNVIPLLPIGLGATYKQMLKNRFYYRTQMRLQKTRILEILPAHVQTAVYMDADIVSVGEGCLDEFIELNAREKWLDDEDLSMSCYQDNKRICGVKTIEDLGRDGRWTLHTGTFVMKRNYSEDLLKRWREHVVESDSLDRNGLVRALWDKYDNVSTIDMRPTDNPKSRRCEHLRPYHKQRKFLPGDHFLPPPDEIDLYLPQMCMLHVSYGRCNNLGKEYVDKVLSGILPKYNNDFCLNDPLGLSRANLPPIEVSYGLHTAIAFLVCIALTVTLRHCGCFGRLADAFRGRKG